MIKRRICITVLFVVILSISTYAVSSVWAYRWPLNGINTAADAPYITGTISEVRPTPQWRINLFGESFTHRDHFHSGVDMARCQGTPVYAVEDDLEVIGVGGSSLTVGSYRYVHIQEIVVREDQDVNEGDQLAEIGPYGAAGCGGDHLHFVEAEEEYPEVHPEFDWGAHLENFEVAKEDPLRRMHIGGGGLDPAPTDNYNPIIRDAGLIHNEGDTTEEWQPFPQLSAQHPDSGPRIHEDTTGNVVNADFDDTWVVWGPVEAWVDAYDPEINDPGHTLGIYRGESSFKFQIEGVLDGTYEGQSLSTLGFNDFFSETFTLQTYDTIPGVSGSLTRSDIAKHAFRDGSQISPTNYYYLLHNNPHGDTSLFMDPTQTDAEDASRGLNRFWDTKKPLFEFSDFSLPEPIFNDDLPFYFNRCFPDGPYKWRVSVEDVSGRTTVDTESVVVDNFWPLPRQIMSIFNFPVTKGVFWSNQEGTLVADGVGDSQIDTNSFEALVRADPTNQNYLRLQTTEPIKPTVIVNEDTKIVAGKISAGSITDITEFSRLEIIPGEPLIESGPTRYHTQLFRVNLCYPPLGTEHKKPESAFFSL